MRDIISYHGFYTIKILFVCMSMTRKYIIPVAACALFLGVGCKSDTPLQSSFTCSGTGPADALWPTGADPQQDSLRALSLFDRILEFEKTILADPSDLRKSRQLLCIARDTAAGCFYVIGQGLPDTTLPEGARPKSRKLSARYSAEKWALRCKAWLSGDARTCREPISGKILFQKELLSRTIGDTLFILYMVPAGSVVVK